jgi:hypothetical protein
VTLLHVEAAVAGRKRAGASDHQLQVPLEAGPTRLRDLIEAIVRAEVLAFTERAVDERLVRVLTEKEISEGLASGAVRSGGREVAADVDPDEAVATAQVAQQDGLYQAFVDDEPVDDLDTVVALRNGTRVMFLRLVPLAGG